MTPDSTVILDIRGLLQHSLHRGRDPDAVLGAKDKAINTADFGLINFINTYLLPILEDEAPLNIVAVWDGGNDLREAWYKGYKAKRKAQDKDPVEEAQYASLFQSAKSLLAGLGVTQVSVPLTEADDMIALLARQVPGYKTIYSVDGDLLQLQGEDPDNVQMYLRDDPMMDDTYHDIPLHLTRLNKSMVGDKSDDYGGVPGFGPAAWMDLFLAFEADGMNELEVCIAGGNYQKLTDAIEAIEGDQNYVKAHRALIKLDDNREAWALGYKLATFHPDACYRVHKRKIVQPQWFRRIPNAQRVVNIMHRLGMMDIYEANMAELMPDQSLVTADNLDLMLGFFIAHCNDGPVIGFDFETWDPVQHQPFQDVYTGHGDYVDVLSQQVTGASFTFGNNLQYTLYVSVDHADTMNVDKSVITRMLSVCFHEKLVVHNANFEVTVAKLDLDYHIESPMDTRILHHYIDEDRLQGHGLKGLSLDFLAYTQDTYKDTLKAAGAANMRELSGEQVLKYGCDDAICTAHMAVQFILDTKCQGEWEEIRDFEFPSVHPLVEGFIAGVNVDQEYLKKISEEDVVVIKDSMVEIRGLLDKYCSEPNDKLPLPYWEAQHDYWKAEAKAKGLDDAAVEEHLQVKWDRLVAATKYVPRQEIRKAVKPFIPTKAQFKKVTVALKYPEGMEILQPNPSGITRWLLEVRDAYIEGTHDEQSMRETFERLVAESAHQFNKRKGDEYDELVNFCNELLGKDAPMEVVGDELNFDSPTDNSELLYCKLGLPVRVRTKFNPTTKRAKLGFDPSPAMDDKALETALAEDCFGDNTWKGEILQAVRRVKSCNTRFKLYYRPYPQWEHPRDGLIHPQIINCGTVTRRPSGTSPNFLQIPKKDGGRIRRSIKGLKKNHVIISPDWAGQELRILASESRDPVLMDAYLGEVPKDVHSITASGITPAVLRLLDPEAMKSFTQEAVGIPYDEFMAALNGEDSHLAKLMKAVRASAKGVNFLINYLGSASTLSRNLSIPREQAAEFMDTTFRRYAGIKPWQNASIRFAEVRGYTATAYGSRRHMSDAILSENKFEASRMHRQAVNARIQGTGANILKRTLTAIHKEKLLQTADAYLIAPVYDELAFSCLIDDVPFMIKELDRIMRITPPGHPISMVPEHCVGVNWGQLIELGASPSDASVEAALAMCRATMMEAL